MLYIMNKPFFIFAAFMFVLLLAGCTPVGMVIGAGATLGSAAVEDRGVAAVASDARIDAEIRAAWLDKDFAIFKQLNLTVREGRVLAAGFVGSANARLEAIRRIWAVSGVKNVYNEIEIDPAVTDGELDFSARDTAISTELRAKITFDDNIYAVNYAIDVVRGVVYLMGIAQNQEELDRVIAVAKHIDYVKRVKSFVRVKGAVQS